MRVRLARGFWTSRFGLILLGSALCVLLVMLGIAGYYYEHFAHLIDQRLSGQIFQNTSRVYGAPEPIFVGERLSEQNLLGDLVRAGYTPEDSASAPGWYRVSGPDLEIHPGASSYFADTNALRVDFSHGAIAKLISLPDGAALGSAETEPKLLTNLFDSSREKRRIVRFEDIPRPLLNAVLSAEDKRFFEHPGFDPFRVISAALTDLRRGAKAQGASTIDMQVARSFFFSTERVWSRKMAETVVALELQHRFSKQQIFELYANEVYLGNRGSFAIRGFGEAAQAYFNKDIRDLSVGEDAFLAGIIRSPNRYSTAERHPERASEARNRVLARMTENGFLTAAQAEAARKVPLHFTSGMDTGAAPNFVDMVKDHLLENISEADLATQSYRVYTTLDPDLQRAAIEAVATGGQNVDQQLARRYAKWRKKGQPVPQVQIALVALDPASGAIRALVGGRNYGESQLNHILARRQPGSSFKPFVYAAALDNSVAGVQPVVTAVTTLDDEPTTFNFAGKDYTPNNFGTEFYGNVSVRDALTHSLNVATVKLAEMIGYDRVVEVARQMGLDPHIQATPAMALGAYEMTPLEVAAGYTIFANDGLRADPMYITKVVGAGGKTLENPAAHTRPALDPRVAYLVTNLLEDVINRGTGASVRKLGFSAPAAGKTGTSRDGWFAGFTSNLLCVVWVGFDDNRDLNLSGSSSAAPIWGDFMNRAVALAQYHNTKPFAAPSGIVHVTIDPESGEVAMPSCPQTRDEIFVAGSEPTAFCHLHGAPSFTQEAPSASWLARLFGKGSQPAPPPNAPPNQPNASPPAAQANAPGGQSGQRAGEEQKKKGLLHKIFGIFGSNKKSSDGQQKPKP